MSPPPTQSPTPITTELWLEIVGSGEPPCSWPEFAQLNEDLGTDELAHIKSSLLAAGECLHDGGAAGVFHLRRAKP